MATATYDLIASQTLVSAAASITFSSIAASWTDLRLVIVSTQSSAGGYVKVQFNGDTASNYSRTVLYGDGTTANSGTLANSSWIYTGDFAAVGGSTTIPTLSSLDIFSYAGSTYKTILNFISNDKNGTGGVVRCVNLWRSTSAITSIVATSDSGTFNTGTTVQLYGIKSA